MPGPRRDAWRRYGETTLVVDPARLVEACTHLRDEQGFNFLSDITPTDYLGWGERGGRRLHRHAPRPRPATRPARRASQRVPDAEAEALRDELPPARASPTTRARVRVQVWLDDGEAVDERRPVWPTADWHEREAWDMMGIRVRRPPEPRRGS